MITAERISFDEATVIRFSRSNNGLEIELEDVLVDEINSRVVLTVSPVTGVSVDGELLLDQDLMVFADGEVFSLEVYENCISAVIEWNDFSQRKSITKAYEILGGDVSISII